MILSLDHFYTDLPIAVFDDLLPLVEYFEPSDHKIVKRPDITYEGVYMFSRQGQYFELLRQEEFYENYTAIVLSPSNPEDFDIDTFSDQFTQYKWKTSELIKTPEDNPWFRSHTPIVKQDTENSPNFIPWLMEYEDYERNRVYQLQKNRTLDKSNFVIDQFLKVCFDVSESIYKEIKDMSAWISEKVILTNETIKLSIDNPNGKDIDFIYQVNSNLQGLQIKSVEMSLNKILQDDLDKIGIINITTENGTCILDFDSYEF